MTIIFPKQKRAAKREEALASFEAWKAMKEKEAKKIAAKKRLEEKNKKKTEEESQGFIYCYYSTNSFICCGLLGDSW